jgi:hypothetical protein
VLPVCTTLRLRGETCIVIDGGLGGAKEMTQWLDKYTHIVPRELSCASKLSFRYVHTTKYYNQSVTTLNPNLKTVRDTT